MAGKPAIITRVVDSMTDNLRPTRAEATDVANAVLDGLCAALHLSICMHAELVKCDLLKMIAFNAGTDGILLGAETLRGLYPVETVQTVGRICAEVSFYI